MNKIRVIDLLNKIANGEKVPKEIKINNDILIWNNIEKDYLMDGKVEYYTDRAFITPHYDLNDEIEIIEEDEQIEKISEIKKTLDIAFSNLEDALDKINRLENELEKENE